MYFNIMEAILKLKERIVVYSGNARIIVRLKVDLSGVDTEHKMSCFAN